MITIRKKASSLTIFSAKGHCCHAFRSVISHEKRFSSSWRCRRKEENEEIEKIWRERRGNHKLFSLLYIMCTCTHNNKYLSESRMTCKLKKWVRKRKTRNWISFALMWTCLRKHTQSSTPGLYHRCRRWRTKHVNVCAGVCANEVINEENWSLFTLQAAICQELIDQNLLRVRL
jgi:hypothetical protein